MDVHRRQGAGPDDGSLGAVHVIEGVDGLRIRDLSLLSPSRVHRHARHCRALK